MSTQDAQTTETTSVETSGSESTGQTQLGEANQQSDVAKGGVDGLKKLAKESAEFKAKSVDEAIKEQGAAPVIPAGPVYQPNFKYKAALQEKEVDEFWRPLIKDQDSEKKVIRALQQIDGLPSVEASRDKWAKDYESLANDYRTQAQVVERVETSLQRGDLTSVFRQLGVQPEQIYRWTHEQLQRMEMPPEQRRAFEEAENLKAQQYQLQEQSTQYQKLYEEQAVQARTVHLDLVLSRPEIAQAAERWDGVMGQHGAFRDLVIQEAQNAWHQSNVDLSAEQAAQMVMQKFGRMLSGQSQPQPAAELPMQVAQQMAQPQIQQPQAKPVIPNINGKGTAPIKKVPKSIDDLKRMAKESAAADGV